MSSQSCKNPPWTDKFEVRDYKNSLGLAGDAGKDDVDDLKLNKTVQMCVGFSFCVYGTDYTLYTVCTSETCHKLWLNMVCVFASAVLL